MSDVSLNRYLDIVSCSLLFNVVVIEASKDSIVRARVVQGSLHWTCSIDVYARPCIALYLFLKSFWTYSPMSIQSWIHYRLARYRWLGNPL